MADIRIKDLPLATGGTAALPADQVAIDGLTTRRVALSTLADVIRPMASQAEAEAGVNTVKGMSPLTTAQAIDAQALKPGEAATPTQGAKADSAMQPTIYDPTAVSGDAFSLTLMKGNFRPDLDMALVKNKNTPFDKNFVQNNVGLAGTFGIKLKTPGFTGAYGFQGVDFYPPQGYFYSSWNRSNGDGTERLNIVRHDRAGNVLDYSATFGPGSGLPSVDGGHGQDLKCFVNNGVLTLLTNNGDGRGASIFVPNSSIGDNWTPTGFRSWILEPATVTAGTVSLSTDRQYVVKTGGPVTGGKNIRIYSLSTLLAGPDGDRQSDCIWEMLQPPMDGLPNQGLWMHDGRLYMLNGTQALSFQTIITVIDIATKTVIDTFNVDTAEQMAALQAAGLGAKNEPEGCFVVRSQAGGPLQFWMGVGQDNADGTGISMFVFPIFQRDFGAAPLNGNRTPFGIAANLSGGPHKMAHPRSERLTISSYENTLEGTVVYNDINHDASNASVYSSYVRDITGVTEVKYQDIDRATGKVTFPAGADVSVTGAWTPTISFGGVSTGIAYSTNSGRYVKNGAKVDAWCRITLTSKGAATGNVSVNALPFTSRNATNSRGNVTVSLYSNMATISQGIFGLVGSNVTTADLRTGGAAASAVLTNANFTDTSDMILHFSYEAA